MIETYWLLFRCLLDSSCSAYQFGEHGSKNCYIIHANTAEGSQQTFTSDANKAIYKKGKISSTYLVKVGLYHNLANAQNLDGLDSYTDEHTPGFLGPNCVDIDDCCLTNTCFKNDTCIETIPARATVRLILVNSLSTG